MKLEPDALVHVAYGRMNHRPAPVDPTWRTRCGKVWAGIVIGPPSIDRPLCPVCAAKERGETAEEGT